MFRARQPERAAVIIVYYIIASLKKKARSGRAGGKPAPGIISTKPALIRYAKSLGLITVQRFFVLDSLALENVRRADSQEAADFVEILPGLMPKVIRRLTDEIRKPVIAGGLISDKEDVVTALGAGAIAISSTNPGVWFM
ncbi:MAG: glycerol-3-phosphate responsive antiterminator [Oscillospiraceae bacterium]|nr:glycerol-3-phosphate responsive antiterminator [Oscillospiraceae bacterium]